eukprot:Tamp_07056.p1 GENE.Tamp_07056~~Tamp_07056.p1  ORF type:complete len:376 (-),score=56.45 Tamp_07056:26-1153(-)
MHAKVDCDPVLAEDGRAYCRPCIEKWFTNGRLTSPLTNLPIGRKHQPLHQSVCTPGDSDQVDTLLSQVKALQQRLVSEKVIAKTYIDAGGKLFVKSFRDPTDMHLQKAQKKLEECSLLAESDPVADYIAQSITKLDTRPLPHPHHTPPPPTTPPQRRDEDRAVDVSAHSCAMPPWLARELEALDHLSAGGEMRVRREAPLASVEKRKQRDRLSLSGLGDALPPASPLSPSPDGGATGYPQTPVTPEDDRGTSTPARMSAGTTNHRASASAIRGSSVGASPALRSPGPQGRSIAGGGGGGGDSASKRDRLDRRDKMWRTPVAKLVSPSIASLSAGSLPSSSASAATSGGRGGVEGGGGGLGLFGGGSPAVVNLTNA